MKYLYGMALKMGSTIKIFCSILILDKNASWTRNLPGIFFQAFGLLIALVSKAVMGQCIYKTHGMPATYMPSLPGAPGSVNQLQQNILAFHAPGTETNKTFPGQRCLVW